jgi:hypothetical protein
MSGLPLACVTLLVQAGAQPVSQPSMPVEASLSMMVSMYDSERSGVECLNRRGSLSSAAWECLSISAAGRAAKRAAASRPRNSKNGTPEERAAKTALRKEKSRAWYRDFGHRLRVTRLALCITEVEAAAASLITLRTYRTREAGLPYRGWDEGLVSFVHKYDLSWNWMLGGSGEMRASAEKARIAEFTAASPAKPALVLVSDNSKPA